MTRETIAIDIDDVVAGTTDSLRLYVNEQTGLQLTTNDYRVPAAYWGYYEHVWTAAGIIDHSHIERYHEGMCRDQSNIDPLPGSHQVLERLSADYNLVAVTSRELAMEKATNAWVHDHFGPIFSNIVLLGHIKTAQKTKGDACRELGAGWLIDDNFGHCESAEKAGASSVLFGEYGWHQEYDDIDIIRSKDWQGVEALFYDRQS
jgi:5'(3')-deoxyribonucleotidase